jgi:putative flavoprotein involved in K+ transport
VERYDTIIVGAGQAGLAVGHHLAARDADFLVVDGATRVGDSWRTRWDSLRLFTPAKYAGLPGMPFPAPPDHLPDKDEVADYLERYATRFDLPVRLSAPVRSLRRDGDRYLLDVGGRRLEATNVVVGTGPFHAPRIPAFASQLAPSITQLHSRDYRNPWELPEGAVLVVGAGNSGAQVAIELARFRRVWLAGRDTGHVPRRLLGRDVFDWLWPAFQYANGNRRIGRALFARMRQGGDALIGIPEEQVRGAGVLRVGRVTGVSQGRPVSDGQPLDARVVIWCTGFAPDYGWIRLPVFGNDGYPLHDRGVVRGAPGLYFIGLRFQHRVTSSLLGGVRDDARWIAEQVMAREDLAIPAG